MQRKGNVSITCFGAGSEVGRSSILAKIGKYKVLLDCGINFVAIKEEDRLPIFPDNLNDIDVILISHIHTDHLAAVPYVTEVLECKAPVYMTVASKRMMRIMLDDFIKVTDNPPYDHLKLHKCLDKVHTVEFYSVFEPKQGLYIQAFPAGHIIGAAAFYVFHSGYSFLYTGDFSSCSDNHLSGHAIPRLFPNILLTESTYGKRTRDSIIKREKSFVQMVYSTVSKGGKVLIPVFAVGRLQEICLMLDDYWERMGYNNPIYYNAGLGDRAMDVYKKSIIYMNQTIQTNYFDDTTTSFAFKHTFRQPDEFPTNTGFVMLATSGMLNYGTSAYNLFYNNKWYDDPNNLIIFPGYCGPNTLGRAILDRNPETNEVNFVIGDRRKGKDVKIISFVVRCKVETISFSAHADQFEIVNMCERVQPEKVVCIHGDEDNVKGLADRIKKVTKFEAVAPKNKENVEVPEKIMRKILIDSSCVTSMFGIPIFFEAHLESKKVGEDTIIKATPLTHYGKSVGFKVKLVKFKRIIRIRTDMESIKQLLKDTKKIQTESIVESGNIITVNGDIIIEVHYDIVVLRFFLSEKKEASVIAFYIQYGLQQMNNKIDFT